MGWVGVHLSMPLPHDELDMLPVMAAGFLVFEDLTGGAQFVLRVSDFCGSSGTEA